MGDDIRQAARALRRRPGFTATTVAALAFGVGAASAIFSVVNAVLLRPLPFGDADRLVVVASSVSPSNFVDWQQQNTVFEGMDAWTESFLNLGGDDGPPERIYGLGVTPTFFETIRVRPALGRSFRREDVDAGRTGPRPVLISHGLWQRRFGGAATVVGRTLTVNGGRQEVIGVLPADFLFLDKRFDVCHVSWFTDDQIRNWRARRGWLTVLARLRPGVTLAQAQAGMDVVTARLAGQYPDANAGRGTHVRSLRDALVGKAGAALWLLQAAVGLVLLIAAANAAHLQLVRGLSRRRELATRAALGATRGRLVRQLFAEGLLLALLGGALGALLAVWGTRVIVAVSPADVPRLTEARVDAGVLAFSLLAALAASLVCGLLPALTSARADLRGALDEGGRSGSAARPRLQRTLVAAEVALSLVLLAGAGLLVKSFLRLQGVDPGFGSNAVALDLTLGGGHGDLPARAQLYEQIVARMEGLPGVRSAGVTKDLPLSGETSVRTFTIVGGGATGPAEPKLDSEIRRVSTRYFDAMGMTIRRGRAFTEGETGTAIVNEAMVQRFLAGHDAIGRQLVIEDGPRRSREIVGVVADVKHFALDAAAPPEIYLSHLDRPFTNMTLVVRAANGEAAALVPGIRRELALVDKNLPAANVKTVAQYLSGSVARQRFSMRLLVLFAAAAVLLAALGIYGVVAYAVAQRTPEIGIRMALGADGGDVTRLVLSDGWRSVKIGLAAGLGASMLIAQAMTGWLYDVSAADPWVFGGVTALLAAVALLASWLPARRAARVDPMVCVRS